MVEHNVPVAALVGEAVKVSAVPTTKLGVAVPNCTEGLMHPSPFASAADAVQSGVRAEALGFDSVWGNDHVSTPRYVRKSLQVGVTVGRTKEDDAQPLFASPFTEAPSIGN